MNYLKQARKNLNITQQKVCDLLGLPMNTLYTWESNKRKTSKWNERLILLNLYSFNIDENYYCLFGHLINVINANNLSLESLIYVFYDNDKITAFSFDEGVICDCMTIEALLLKLQKK